MKKGLLLTLGSVVSLVIIFTLMKTKEEPTFSPLKTVVKNTNENQKKKIKRVSIKPLQTKEELKKNYTSLSPRISEVTTDAKEVEYASPAEELYRKNFQEALDKGYGKTPVITKEREGADGTRKVDASNWRRSIPDSNRKRPTVPDKYK